MKNAIIEAVGSITKPLPHVREIFGFLVAIAVLTGLSKTDIFGPNTPGFHVNMETWVLQWVLIALPVWFIVSGGWRAVKSRKMPRQKQLSEWGGLPRLFVGLVILAIGIGYFALLSKL